MFYIQGLSQSLVARTCVTWTAARSSPPFDPQRRRVAGAAADRLRRPPLPRRPFRPAAGGHGSGPRPGLPVTHRPAGVRFFPLRLPASTLAKRGRKPCKPRLCMKAAVIVFPGSNAIRDVAVAVEAADRLPRRLMVWHRDTRAAGLDLIVLPGGFSYGDYLRMAAPWPRHSR